MSNKILSNISQISKSWTMGLDTLNGKAPRPLMWVGSRTARGEIRVSGVHN
jgi:hypothetical protein